MNKKTRAESPSGDVQVCLLTPPGPAGIAVIQIAGAGALDILHQIFVGERFPADPASCANRLYFGQVFDRQERLDDAIVWWTPSKGGWLVEVQCHGGSRVCERILQRAAALGAELVPRGDEPDDDVIANAGTLMKEMYHATRRAETRPVARWILHQREALTECITDAISYCERQDFAGAQGIIQALLERNSAADILLDGAQIALLGPPNAGKSTLANALLGKEGSIVAAGVGTTRDWVRHACGISGVPVAITDTAGLQETGGLHETAGLIERESIARSLHQARSADLVILVLDRSVPWPTPIIAQISPHAANLKILAANKCDLPPAWNAHEASGEHGLKDLFVVEISALLRRGLSHLAAGILEGLGLANWHAEWPALWTRRQRDLATEALRLLGQSTSEAITPLRRISC